MRHHPSLLEQVQRIQAYNTTGTLVSGEMMSYLLRLTNLRRLAVVEPGSLFYLSKLSSLWQLRQLVLREAEHLYLTPLQELPSLRALRLLDCGPVHYLAGLSLTKLQLWDTAHVPNFTVPTTLESLAIDNQPLEGGFAPLTRLTRLVLSDDMTQNGLQGLAQLPALHILECRAASASFAALPQQQQLQQLTLTCCDEAPAQLSVLGSLTQLRRLALHHVWDSPAISLPSLTALLLLYISGSGQDTLPALQWCGRLQSAFGCRTQGQ